MPPLHPYEILIARDTLKDERNGVLDSLRQLATTVSQVLASGLVSELPSACQFVIESKIDPRLKELQAAAHARSSSGFRTLLRQLVDPGFLIIKALDPTEKVSKWDFVKEGVKYLLKDKGSTVLRQNPEDFLAMFALRTTKTLQEMRPTKFA